MPVFEYRAVTGIGRIHRGVLTADNPREARDRLRSQGLRVQDLRAGVAATSRKWSLPGWSKASAEWGDVAHELSTLLGGGVSLIVALDTVSCQASSSIRQTLLAVRERVAAGASLATAIQEHPAVFDELSVRMVEVGENAGNLDIALDRLATFKRRWNGLRDRVISALIYPIFVLAFGSAATLFLMTYVMPPLLENLRENLDQLPWPTRIVKAGSDIILEHGFLVGVSLATISVIGWMILRSSWGRTRWGRFQLGVPIFGKLLVKQSLARVSLILATLLQSGLPLATALNLSAKSLGNCVLREAFHDCCSALEAGRDLAGSLAETQVIPPLAVQIFAVGQESGRLEELLARLADDYDRQVESATSRLAAVIEPVLILILAAMIGFVLLAIVLPILEAGNVAI